MKKLLYSLILALTIICSINLFMTLKYKKNNLNIEKTNDKIEVTNSYK
ncbi:hypothetical protein [Clostridium sp. KNHs214]|nr:hypothetical protein [Clostridium sp. KNHs214]